MRQNILIVSMLILLSGLLMTEGRIFNCAVAEAAEAQGKGAYHCPMHPQITSDRKGPCPICGMDLVKSVSEVDVPDEPNGGLKGVAINSTKQQLIGVKKAVAARRPLLIEIATVGKVAYDPELYVAQEEYLQALKTVIATKKSALVSIREQAAELLASSEKKLILSGMSKAEVAALKISGQAEAGLYSSGNSGKAWVYLTIYEYELGLVKEGQKVSIDAMAYPGNVFRGQITALTPVVNAESRSVRARAEVDDKEGKLKPEMFVNAKIMIDLGVKLAVPEEAVMDSGTRKIVYVVRNDRFEARDVILGPKATEPVKTTGEFYQVIDGLKEGEEIVTSGNFLIDAESKLKGSL